MTPPHGLLLLLLLLLLVCRWTSVAAQETAALELLKAVQRHLHSQCVYVLYSDVDGRVPDPAQQLLFARMALSLTYDNASVGILPSSRFLSRRGDIHCDNRPLYYVASGDDARSFLQQLSDSPTWGFTGPVPGAAEAAAARPPPKRPVWLTMLRKETSISEFFKGVDIPFDCQFIVAKVYGPMTRLTEVYRVAKGLPLKDADCANLQAGKLTWSGRDFYDRRDSLKGLVLDVIVKESKPFSGVARDRQGKVAAGGLVGKVWKALERQLNYTTRYAPLPDTDNRTKIAKMVSEGAAHVAVMDFTLTKERLQLVDFTYPIVATSFSIFIEHMGYREIKWGSYLQPFRMELWLIELLSLVTLAVLLAMFYYMGRTFGSPDMEDDNTFTVYNSFFYMVGIFCMQGHDITPRSCSCRMVYLVGYLTAIVLMAAYSAALISFLAVQTASMPYDNVEDFLYSGSHHFGYKMGSAENQIIQESRDATIRKLVQDTRKNKLGMPASYTEGFERVCSSKFAFMAPMDYAITFNNEMDCDIVNVPGFEIKIGLSFAIVKNSPYKGVFDHNIKRMRKSGSLQKLLNDVRPKRLPIVPNELTSVDVNNIMPILVALAIGSGIAFVLMAGENVVKVVADKIDKSTWNFFNNHFFRSSNKPRFVV